jgi:hypothetical protein
MFLQLYQIPCFCQLSIFLVHFVTLILLFLNTIVILGLELIAFLLKTSVLVLQVSDRALVLFLLPVEFLLKQIDLKFLIELRLFTIAVLERIWYNRLNVWAFLLWCFGLFCFNNFVFNQVLILFSDFILVIGLGLDGFWRSWCFTCFQLAHNGFRKVLI